MSQTCVHVVSDKHLALIVSFVVHLVDSHSLSWKTALPVFLLFWNEENAFYQPRLIIQNAEPGS